MMVSLARTTTAGFAFRSRGQKWAAHAGRTSVGRKCLRLLICAGVLSGLLGGTAAAQVPSPPGTDSFSVQMFLGGTQFTYLAVNPPTTFTSGAPIPVGTPVSIRIYRSTSGLPGTFTDRVQLDFGGSGTVGMGAAGTQQKSWIDIRAITPVNCVEPCLIFLAATSVVNNVEGPPTTANLSFRYAVAGSPPSSTNCFPVLIRFPTPAAALASAGAAAGPTVPPGTLAPDPPGTGPFTVQMFVGGTQYTYLALNPPTSYATGSLIPNGTPVTIKLYRSFDLGATYSTAVTIAAGGQGVVGQGPAGSRRMPWIDLTALTPVDCKEPCIVFLAATAVVGGIESAMTTDNLTFRYAVASTSPGSLNNCIPILIRFATPFGVATGGGMQIPTRVINTANPLNPSGGISVSIALVIDMSGSMASTPPGGNMSKVAMAKQAAIESLKRVPAGAEVCLISFGRAGCDVNVESRFTTDLASVEAMIRALNGMGSTPMAAAMYKARDVIVNEGHGLSGRMVLLSDGEESCKGDPLKAAQDVRNKAAQKTTSLLDKLLGFSGPLYAQAATAPTQGQTQNPTPQNWVSQDPNQLPPDQSQPGALAQSQQLQAGQAQSRSQMDIQINPIGLGIDPNSPHFQTLNQIAQITGGQAYSANNLSQLTQALSGAVTQSVVAPASGGGMVIPASSQDWPMILIIALPVAGLVLVGAALAIRQRQATAGPKISAQLDVVYPDGRTRNFPVRGRVVTIGRAGQNLLSLDDPEVSSAHAELLVTPEGFSLRDRGSANGTYLNGRKITEERVYADDEIRVGSIRLVLRR